LTPNRPDVDGISPDDIGNPAQPAGGLSPQKLPAGCLGGRRKDVRTLGGRDLWKGRWQRRSRPPKVRSEPWSNDVL